MCAMGNWATRPQVRSYRRHRELLPPYHSVSLSPVLGQGDLRLPDKGFAHNLPHPTLPARSRPGLWPAIVAVMDRLLLRTACQHRRPPCHQGRLKEKPSELPSDFITVQFAALWCRTFYFPPCCLLLHGKNVDQCFPKHTFSEHFHVFLQKRGED